jgi:Bestrophin, RFP-TM, chloride channel
MRKFLTTPFPFPLVQMARTFLFFCKSPKSSSGVYKIFDATTHINQPSDVFTVPFALLSDSSDVYAHCVMIFILTYGFMGLETVSIELDNPFGNDDIDFNNLGMAYVSAVRLYNNASCAELYVTCSF